MANDLFRKEKTPRDLANMLRIAMKLNVIHKEQMLHDWGGMIQEALIRLAIIEEAIIEEKEGK